MARLAVREHPHVMKECFALLEDMHMSLTRGRSSASLKQWPSKDWTEPGDNSFAQGSEITGGSAQGGDGQEVDQGSGTGISRGGRNRKQREVGGSARMGIPREKSEEAFSCSTCDMAFQDKKHIQVNEEKYHCKVCGKQSAQDLDLVHLAVLHTGVKPHQCDICDKRFSQSYNLKIHKRIHTSYKPHQCNVCDKRFSRFYNLTVHKRIHTGFKPYPCDVCGKRYTRSSYRTVHRRIHLGEKPYPCNV